MSQDVPRRTAWWLGIMAAIGGALGSVLALVLDADPLMVVGACVLGGVLAVALASAIAELVLLAASAVGLDMEGRRFPALRQAVRWLEATVGATQR